MVAGVTWQGQADVQLDPRFVTFKTPQYGFRALARTLLTYQNAHGLKTINQLISRFAPPSDDNPTATYAKLVADECGVGVNDVVMIDQVDIMLPMCRAIAREESGVQAPWPDSVIAEGLHMAGVADAKPKPLVKQNTFMTQVGTGVAVVGAGATQVAQYAPTVKGWADQLSDYTGVPVIQHVVAVMLTVAGGLTVLGIVAGILKQKAA